MFTSLIDKALEKRATLFKDPDTDSFRIFDGDGDGLSDIYIDQLKD